MGLPLVRLAVDDVDLMEALVNTAPSDDMEGCDMSYVQLERGTLRGSYQGQRSDPLARDLANAAEDSPHPGRLVLNASHQRYGARLRIRGSSPRDRTDYYLFLRSTRRVLRGGTELPPGVLIELPAGSEMDFRTEELELLTLSFPDRVLDGILQSTGHRSTAGSLRLSDLHYGRLAAALQEYLEACRLELVDELMEQRVVEDFACALAALPETASPRISGERRREAVRRAEDYLHEHLHRAVPGPELATAAGVPLRTLQQGFREQFGVPPYAFHARLRFEAARRLLMRSTPDSAMVGDVATRLGFTHLGRFSRDYRAEFGESPSQTLKRPPARWSRHARRRFPR